MVAADHHMAVGVMEEEVVVMAHRVEEAIVEVTVRVVVLDTARTRGAFVDVGHSGRRKLGKNIIDRRTALSFEACIYIHPVRSLDMGFSSSAVVCYE